MTIAAFFAYCTLGVAIIYLPIWFNAMRLLLILETPLTHPLLQLMPDINVIALASCITFNILASCFA